MRRPGNIRIDFKNPKRLQRKNSIEWKMLTSIEFIKYNIFIIMIHK